MSACPECEALVSCWKYCSTKTHGYQLTPAKSLQPLGAARAGLRAKQKKPAKMEVSG